VHIVESVPGIGTRLVAEFLVARGRGLTAFGAASCDARSAARPRGQFLEHGSAVVRGVVAGWRSGE